jgi:hypothetical protein
MGEEIMNPKSFAALRELEAIEEVIPHYLTLISHTTPHFL